MRSQTVICMGSYKSFHAVNMHILVVNSQYNVAVSFTVCNYKF